MAPVFCPEPVTESQERTDARILDPSELLESTGATRWLPNCASRSMGTERTREILTGPLTSEHLQEKAAEGWKPVAVVWERQTANTQPRPADIAEPVPFGLKIAEDCVELEQDVQEKEALLVMLELIVLDKPLSEIAEVLNQRGLRTRHKSKWTPGTVFDMLPRLIEVGARVFSTDEWAVRRGRIMNAH